MEMYRQFTVDDLTPPPRPETDLLFGGSGAMCGMMFCDVTEYGKLNQHEDQEGFLVLEGHGSFRINDEDVKVGPDMSILIPAHTWHAFRKDPDSPDMKIFYFHAAN